MSGAVVNFHPLSKPTSNPPFWIRGLALIVMLLCVGLFFIGIFTWFSYAYDHPEVFTSFSLSVEEMTQLLERANLTLSNWIDFQLATGLFSAACYCIVGGLIFIKKKNDWFGLFLSVVLVFYGTITSNQVFILQDQYPWSSFLLQPLSVATWACWFIIFYLFPNGHFTPRWMRWFAVLLLIGFVIDILFYQGHSPPTWLAVILLPGIGLALASQIYRYWRVSDSVERQQVKWILFAILVLGCVLLIGMFAVIFPEWTEFNSPGALFPLFYSIIATLLSPIFPISIGFAILRYRLWDIDVLIRRTLQYSLLTGLLALVYFGTVTILQSVFSTFTDQQSPAALVISTLAIAALFTPMRRRVQDFIDRRFFRRKYDGEKALRAFATAARSEADLAQLSASLTSTIQETLQPASVSLWMQATALIPPRPSLPGPKTGLSLGEGRG